MSTTLLKITIAHCARCNQTHQELEFRRFALQQPKQYTHFAMCPALGEPILMWIEEE